MIRPAKNNLMNISSRFVELYLAQREPNFDNVCVVCNQPCNLEDRVLLKSISSIPMAGAEFVPTREFNVPAHKGKCAKKLASASWKGQYLITIIAILYAIISGSITFMFHLPLKDFMLSLIPLIIGGCIYIIFSSFRICIGINEVKPNEKYLFWFRNTEYAKSFRNLNFKYLKD